MNTKKVRVVVDVLMTVSIFILMAKQLAGVVLHEYIGILMTCIWVFHIILNRRWYLNIFKGKYSFYRVLQTSTNILLIFSVVCIFLSGVIISENAFTFLNINRNIEIAQILHIFFSFWYLVLMSVHLGLHWNLIMKSYCKRLSTKHNLWLTWGIRICLILVVIYGIFSIAKNDILSYLFLKSSYVFFDFERPLLLYVTEYLGVIAMFAIITHYGIKFVNICKHFVFR